MSGEPAPDPNEEFLYSSYYTTARAGDVYYKRVRTGFLRWSQIKFRVTRTEKEVGVFRDYETYKIYSQRWHHYGVRAH